MTKVSLCLFVFTMTADAQTIPRDMFVSQLNSELLALKFLPGLPNGQVLPDVLTISNEDRSALRAMLSKQNPAQDQVMLRYAGIMARTYENSVIPWDLAFALTSVLAGKDLSNDALTPLTNAIVESVDGAFVCKDSQSVLRKSVQFRSAVERAYQALLTLEVNIPNTRVVIGGLLKAGNLICDGSVLVRPIPPAFTPR